MSKQRQRSREATRGLWIRLRYCLPAVTLLITVLSGFLPCYSFFSSQAGYTNSLSLWSWIGERLETTRENLFNESGAIVSAGGTMFVQVEFVLLPTFILCFAFGAVACVYLTLKALEILRTPEEYDNGRVWFMTLVPNRIAFCLWQLPLLPLLLFPRLWVWLAGQMLSVEVRLSLSFAEPWMIAAVLLLAQWILSAVCAKWERVSRENVFWRPRSGSDGDGEPSEDPTTAVTEEEDSLRQFKSEQIRRLLANEEPNAPNRDQEEKDRS